MDKKVSILIPIHNRLSTTKIGLWSLTSILDNYYRSGKKLIEYNIVIIDDGSTDGSFEWIAENYPKIDLLKGDGNLWWTGAINMGVRFALDNIKSDYILLWNDDIIGESDFFIRAENTFLELNDNNIIFGAKIVDADDTTTILSCGGFFNKYTGVETIIRSKLAKKYAGQKYIEVESLTGMGTFIHKDVISTIGLWDILLPHYKADSDYILTAKTRGYKILVNQELIIKNEGSKSGVPKTIDFTEFKKNLYSTRSPYNLSFLKRYAKKHGVAPFSYFGILVELMPVFLGLVKRTLIKKIA